MPSLDLVIAPHPIFRTVSAPVTEVTDETRALIDALFDVLDRAEGLGLAAPMCGIATRIIAVDLREPTEPRRAYINPEVIEASPETQTFTEASLSYPGISAEVSRPAQITLRYLDSQGISRTEQAEGWRAQVIQHEIDYLDGRTYLDHLKPVKRQMLLEKMKKIRRRDR